MDTFKALCEAIGSPEEVVEELRLDRASARLVLSTDDPHGTDRWARHAAAFLEELDGGRVEWIGVDVDGGISVVGIIAGTDAQVLDGIILLTQAGYTPRVIDMDRAGF